MGERRSSPPLDRRAVVFLIVLFRKLRDLREPGWQWTAFRHAIFAEQVVLPLFLLPGDKILAVLVLRYELIQTLPGSSDCRILGVLFVSTLQLCSQLGD